MNNSAVLEVSPAKREILDRLVEEDWTPTELASAVDKSVSTVYNHLDELAARGILTEREVPAKTRPRTEYSLGDGFIQYVGALPGGTIERTLSLETHKAVIVRIWELPQLSFQDYAERFWWMLRTHETVDIETDVAAVALYGSVAEGTANEDANLDVLVLTEREEHVEGLKRALGSVRVAIPDGTKRAVCEVVTTAEFLEARSATTGFLGVVHQSLHRLYDPEGILQEEAV